MTHIHVETGDLPPSPTHPHQNRNATQRVCVFVQIRASTPMFLMSRKIKARGVKMVLSGEGADEIFGGYLYFHKAPNAKCVCRTERRKGKERRYLLARGVDRRRASMRGWLAR